MKGHRGDDVGVASTMGADFYLALSILQKLLCHKSWNKVGNVSRMRKLRE